MTYYKVIEKKRWYFRLKPKDQNKGLFSDFPRSSLKPKMIVCWDYPGFDKNQRLYSFFNNYIDFCFYFLSLSKKFQSFYEIILGETIQKPHFDLDMELEEENGLDEKVLNDLCNAIITVLSEVGIELNSERDICVYSSHGRKGKLYKKSYHLVINNYCHTNNQEAKAFYYQVMGRLPKEYFENKWVDPAVYSKTQQFRSLGSSKGCSNRYKKLEETWKLNGKEIHHQLMETPDNERHKFLLELEESLVTGRISTCKLLPLFEIPEERKKYKKVGDIDIDYAKEAIILLAENVGMNPEDYDFPYRFDKVDGPFVILKRVRPSRCRLCQRIHHNQNPYLLITDEHNVFFHCRRAPSGRNLFVGSLEKEDSIEIKNEWVQTKIEKLKEIAASSVPRKKKVIEYNPQIILEKIMDKF